MINNRKNNEISYTSSNTCKHVLHTCIILTCVAVQKIAVGHRRQVW